jgi:nitronate monooxygenase
MNTTFTALLEIEFPIIMAPMFLVSNEAMMKAGMQSGIMATFPSLNYRKEGELATILQNLKSIKSAGSKGNYGVNIIVQQSNPFYKKHLAICIEERVPFFITSLGNPKEVIAAAHTYGGKVFCDVTNIAHAEKCHAVGCDGFIAVGQGAGGHAGPNPLHILIPALKAKFPNTPVIGAGGIVNGDGLLSLMVLGASGASIGTRFIASNECQVNTEYKNAILEADMDDIVMTTKLSGTPCTIIDTPSAKKMGYTQNWLERWLSQSPRTKKWFKMLIQIRGMKKLEQSILPNNYNTLWCAGKSVELIHDILPCSTIVDHIKKEFESRLTAIKQFSIL